jgi:predicted negative regulator of RcsB-dependent stress response
MFALSFGKIVLLAIVIGGAWFGYRWWQRVQKVSREEAIELARARARQVQGEDMVRCPTCETFLSPRTARACGREGCPYPG